MNDWDPLLADHEARRRAAVAMGGEDALRRQGEAGRLDARTRVECLLDPGSFVEIGDQVGSGGRGLTPALPADGLIAGSGSVAGRPLLVAAEDFTVMGGTIGPGNHAKRARLAELAERARVPLVLLLEGAGERAQSAYDGLPFAPTDLRLLARLRGRVPLISAVLGASVARGAVTVPLTDLTVMTSGAALAVAGPPVVAATTGHDVSLRELGGAAVQCDVGTVHAVVDDDRAALAWVRTVLGYLPASAGGPLPVAEGATGPDRGVGMLDVLPADPATSYPVLPVLECLADADTVLELAPDHGGALTTALLRLAGTPCAIVASNPAVDDGRIGAAAAAKAARFLERIGPFGLPVLFLADTPGLSVGPEAEQVGTLAAAARLYESHGAITGPTVHVTLRRAYDLGGPLLGLEPHAGHLASLALPGARWGRLPAESGAAAVDADRGGVRALVEHGDLGGAYAGADQSTYDGVVDPRRLRDRILAALSLAGWPGGAP